MSGNSNTDLLRGLPIQYVGDVNILGDCFCFGLAIDHTAETHKAYPLYLNLAGAASSVEGAWARLAQGKELVVVPTDRNLQAVYVNPPEKGLYVRVQRKIEGLGIDNLILLHRQLAQPDFIDNAYAYLLAAEQNQACARLTDYVSKVVKVAVFPAWGDYLRRQGHAAGLFSLRLCNDLELWKVKLDVAGWTDVICAGLRKGTISLPD